MNFLNEKTLISFTLYMAEFRIKLTNQKVVTSILQISKAEKNRE